jgi:hypothetical protein
MKAMVLPHGSLRSYIQSPTPIAYDTGFGTILLRIGPVFPVCICPDCIGATENLGATKLQVATAGSNSTSSPS